MLALGACAGKPKKAKPSPRPPVVETLPTAPERPYVRPRARYVPRSIKSRILMLASQEWDYFGKQRVVYEDDEESIPHVGYWEDDDYRHSDRVNEYWRAAYNPQLTGQDCRQPWSAAFISWVMNAAGVPEDMFPPAQAHWVYLSEFLARGRDVDSFFVPRTIQEYSPKPGDLICASREPGISSYISEPPPAYLLENTKLHCDIVVEKDGRTLYAIGGNVRNSVSKSALTLTPDGHLQPTRSRPWFLVIENRLN